ncbi:MAG: hypothetical protein QOD60_9 [Solirubrobacterales bacterium]|nr:hypothetical protein [Solirubrobacterales bacterium]
MTGERDPRARWALAAVMVAAAALLLWLTRTETFFADEWNFLVGYPDWSPGTLLHPNSGNLIAAPAVLYKTMTAVFGADDYLPFRLLWVGLDLLSAGLFYSLTRRRVGDWIALAPTTLLLFFGASWEVFGGPLGITILMAVAAGLGMLLCLERGDRAGDAGAAVLLALSIATYTIGLAFAVGAVVELAVGRGREGWRRAWVIAAPLLLYGAWRAWAAKYGGTDVGFSDVLTLPGSVANSMAAVCAAISGSFRDPVNSGLALHTEGGRVFAVLLAGIVVWRLFGPAGRAVDRRVWIFVAMPLTYWALIGANLGPLRTPDASRYLYGGAVFVLLLLTQLYAGTRLGRRGYAVLAVALAFCLLGNLANLRDASRFLRDNGDENRGELTALELAGPGRVDRNLLVEPLTGAITPLEDMAFFAGPYFDAFAGEPSPAYPPAELPRRPEHVRVRADIELVRAFALTPVPAPPTAALGACLTFAPNPVPGTRAFRVAPGGFTVRGAAITGIALRRFGDEFAATLSPPPPGQAELVAIPADRSPLPWYAQVTTSAPVTICPA